MSTYRVYDVFTDTPGGGNPLAVVFDADGLSDEDCQRIAREFGFSETTFVMAPDRDDTDVRVRIFTPVMELPFAGHPTVGTAIALHDTGRTGPSMTLGLNVGPISVDVSAGTARFTTRVPLTVEDGPGADAVGACIGQSADVVRTDTHPPVFAGVGTPFVLAELTGPAALATASPDLAAFRDTAGPEMGRLGLLIYIRDGSAIRARMFAPLGGILEDPATGSAAAALASYLGRVDGRSQRFEITQGVEMGRPSKIGAEVIVEDGLPVEVAISGQAVAVMEGRLLSLDPRASTD